MRNTTRVTPWNRCTIQVYSGAFCDEPALPNAPYPVCLKHSARIYEWVKYFVREIDHDDSDGVNALARLLNPRPTTPFVPRESPGVVYFLRVGDLIKVGHSRNLHSRMKGYPPTARVLATEPGGRDLEAQRLAQFDAALASGREWFHPSAALIAHINSLRDFPLTAAEFAA